MSTHPFVPGRYFRLFASDSLNVTRDPTLLFAILFSAAPALAGFFFRDALDRVVEDTFGLPNVFTLVLPMLLCIPAFMIGWVTGFLFLEDRDDGPLLALDVTPLGKRGFMAYRIAVTAVITFALTLLGCVLLLPERGVATALVLSMMVALDAVGAALILPAIARNKVEGLALTKVTNILSLAPLLALLPMPWRYLGGWLPTFWVGEIILNAGDFPSASFLAATALGGAVHVIVVWLLYTLQNQRAG
jgi:fluoroquinolone transport system permease protein